MHMLREVISFAVVGAMNTMIGFSVFLFGLYALNLSIFLSNALGYAAALTVAFFLSKKFVFGSKFNSNQVEFVRFIMAFFVAFGANQVLLWVLSENSRFHDVIVQILSMSVYTFTLFAISKLFVFR